MVRYLPVPELIAIDLTSLPITYKSTSFNEVYQYLLTPSPICN